MVVDLRTMKWTSQAPVFGVNFLFRFTYLTRERHKFAGEKSNEKLQKNLSENLTIRKKQATSSTNRQAKSRFDKNNRKRVSLLHWNGDSEAIRDIPTVENSKENESLSPWSKGFRKIWTVFHEIGAFKYPISQNITGFLQENKAEQLNIEGKTLSLTELAELFCRMQKRGCNAETAALNTFLQVHCEAGKTGQANALLRDLISKIQINRISFEIILNGWCKARKVKKALKVFDEMRRRTHVNVVLYNTLLLAMCKENELNEASELMERMASDGCHPNAVTYKILIQSLCKADKVEMAAKVYNLFVRYYCKTRGLGTALGLVGEMKQRGCSLDGETYELLIRRLCMQNRMHKAHVLWEDMRAEGWKAGSDLYGFMIRAFCSRCELGNAFSLLEDMIGKRLVPQRHIWHVFCVKCLKTGEVNRVDRLKDTMIRGRVDLRLLDADGLEGMCFCLV